MPIIPDRKGLADTSLREDREAFLLADSTRLQPKPMSASTRDRPRREHPVMHEVHREPLQDTKTTQARHAGNHQHAEPAPRGVSRPTSRCCHMRMAAFSIFGRHQPGGFCPRPKPSAIIDADPRDVFREAINTVAAIWCASRPTTSTAKLEDQKIEKHTCRRSARVLFLPTPLCRSRILPPIVSRAVAPFQKA